MVMSSPQGITVPSFLRSLRTSLYVKRLNGVSGTVSLCFSVVSSFAHFSFTVLQVCCISCSRSCITSSALANACSMSMEVNSLRCRRVFDSSALKNGPVSKIFSRLIVSCSL